MELPYDYKFEDGKLYRVRIPFSDDWKELEPSQFGKYYVWFGMERVPCYIIEGNYYPFNRVDWKGVPLTKSQYQAIRAWKGENGYPTRMREKREARKKPLKISEEARINMCIAAKKRWEVIKMKEKMKND